MCSWKQARPKRRWYLGRDGLDCDCTTIMWILVKIVLILWSLLTTQFFMTKDEQWQSVIKHKLSAMVLIEDETNMF